jgi:hypothetical protein
MELISTPPTHVPSKHIQTYHHPRAKIISATHAPKKQSIADTHACSLYIQTHPHDARIAGHKSFDSIYVKHKTTCFQNGWQLKEQTIKENDIICFSARQNQRPFRPSKPRGYFTYHQAFCLHNVFMCFIWISKQIIISLHKNNQFFL